MPKLKVDKRTYKKIAVGDMRDRIDVRKRDISAPDFDSPAGFGESYNTLFSAWCKVKTNVSGRDSFDGVNEDTGGGVILSSTHTFTIRFRDGVTSENVVQFKGNNYKINRIVNPEERNEYLELHCKVLGDRELEANQ